MGALSGSGDNGPQRRSLSSPLARLREGAKMLSAMADGPTHDRGRGDADVLEVHVTVLARSRSGRLPMRVVAALVGLLTAVVALGITGGHSRRHSGRVGTRLVRAAGPAGVAAAYGYPERCLSVTILAAYARADFDHDRACGRYSGDTVAILHRLDGAWHLILDASAYSCPLTAIPLAVQGALGVCDVRNQPLATAGAGRGARPRRALSATTPPTINTPPES